MGRVMKFPLIIVLSILILIQGCSGITPDENQSFPESTEDARRAKRGKISGEGGIKLFDSSSSEDDSSSGIGVNSFLWRASLDALSFAPLSSVDPLGGVIITEWYEDPAAKGEKFKINVIILGKKLRADGLRVSVFKKANNNGVWEDAPISTDLNRQLEDKILTRARELRIKSAQ